MSFRGRGAWFLSARRLKSLKCFVIGAAVLNLLLLLSLAWKTVPITAGPADAVVPKLLLNNSVIYHAAEVQTRLDDQSIIQKGGANGLIDNSDRHSHDRDGGPKTTCSFRTAVYMSNIHIQLNQPPFVDYVKTMSCLEGGNIAVFDDKFVKFNNVIIDSTKTTNTRKGGEKMEEVWNQKEDEEYFNLVPGFFKTSCHEKPNFSFSPLDHLKVWDTVLECYKSNGTDLTQFPIVRGTTLAIQRYEYVNLYHTMTDFYNAFVLMLIFGVPPSKLNILAVDAHPEGTLDSVWMVLFGKFIRAGRLEQPTLFQNLVWGLLGYFSPLNEHFRSTVPYLEEFRYFFLSSHNVSTDHVVNCKRPNVVLIWRRDYVAHPRNPQGSVVRKFDNEDEMVEEVKKTLGQDANVEGLQLDNMPMTDQLKAVSKADILIGMHGAGLSHILFLPTTSGVIEFKPDYSNPSLEHFKSMARWRNLPYTIWHNDDSKNEKAAHRTYIPPEVMRKTVLTIYKEICKAAG